jgi:hypothetical protein
MQSAATLHSHSIWLLLLLLLKAHSPSNAPLLAQHQCCYCLDQLGNIHWHLINLCAVELLNVTQDFDVIALDEVDGHTLAPEAPAASDAVNVQLTVVGQVIVDHKRNLRSSSNTMAASAT